MAFEKIGTINVDSSLPTNLTFTAIPGDAKDLYLKFSLRTNTATLDDSISFVLNGSSAGFELVSLWASSSSSYATSETDNFLNNHRPANGNNVVADAFSNGEFKIYDYSSTTTRKHWDLDSHNADNDTGRRCGFTSGRWDNTAAITEVTLSNSSGFREFSSVSLYKVY